MLWLIKSPLVVLRGVGYSLVLCYGQVTLKSVKTKNCPKNELVAIRHYDSASKIHSARLKSNLAS